MTWLNVWLLPTVSTALSLLLFLRHVFEYYNRAKISRTEHASTQHLRFLQLSTLTNFALVMAHVCLLVELTLREVTFNPNIPAIPQTIKLSIFMVSGFLNVALGVFRLQLFEQLMSNRKRTLTRLLLRTDAVIVSCHCIRALVAVGFLVARLQNAYQFDAVFNAIALTHTALFFVHVTIIVMVDAILAHCIFSSKLKISNAEDERILRKMKVVVTALCLNFIILIIAGAVSTIGSIKIGVFGIGETLVLIYYSGNMYCLRLIKQVGSLQLKSMTRISTSASSRPHQ
ncbi:hypothetical protein BKA69DRAFT_1065533 [Paraphysoderma sedebokerense]|nr:hypothetical protein BKA69DRAFT_1065533 [Paraphysoderma sedebokerense]